MLLYATVIPYNTIESENYDISQELFKVIINCIEVVFILMALKNKLTFGEVESEAYLKVLSVSLAWALSESVFSYSLYFLINANSEEFKWEYIQTAISANIDLLERIAIVALVECYRKYEESGKTKFHLLVVLLVKHAISNMGHKYIGVLKNEDHWIKLAHKFSITLIFAIIVNIIFNTTYSSANKEALNSKKAETSRSNSKRINN